MENIKKPIIIYHKEDNDGVVSGALALTYLQHELPYGTTIAHKGCDYNDMDAIAADIENFFAPFDCVIMTDISFNDFSKMKYLHDKLGDRFVWVDHHAPIINESMKRGYDSKITGERATDRSAIMLMWKFLYDPLDENYFKLYDFFMHTYSRGYTYDLFLKGGQASEFISVRNYFVELLYLLSAYDSWTYGKMKIADDSVIALNKGFFYEFGLDIQEIANWADSILYHKLDKYVYHSADSEHYINKGEAIVAAQKIDNALLMQTSADMTWTVDGNRTAAVLFLQGPTSSIMFESVADKVDHGVVFKRRKDGGWVMSLYNTKNDSEYHCGNYLRKKYKGGGHAGASGCQLTEAQFIRMLKKKAI